jgi:hypothetical protein
VIASLRPAFSQERVIDTPAFEANYALRDLVGTQNFTGIGGSGARKRTKILTTSVIGDES